MFPTFEIVRTIEQSNHPELLKATIQRESEWDPHAYSMGNYGFCQIRLIAAKEISDTLTIEDLKNPIVNVKIGDRILNRLMKKYKNNQRVVTQKYIQGEYYAKRDTTQI